MPFDVAKAIETVGDAVKGISDYAKTAKKRQSETQIIKELKKLEKAVDTAEKMFNIFFRYFDRLEEEDKKEIERMLKKFQRNN
jgi:Na+/phosphate symporter|nr:MAG TPA: hypothetical protein [Caudoviricetes sp.]